MKFTPKTQDQIDNERLLPEGKYPFTVLEAEERNDSKDRPFFRVKLNVHGPNDRDWHVYDNVSPNWMEHKLLHLCSVLGLSAKYETGSVGHHDLQGRQGYCEIGKEPGTGNFGPKNVVVDYVPQAETKPVAKAASSPADKRPEDDDVPF